MNCAYNYGSDWICRSLLTLGVRCWRAGCSCIRQGSLIKRVNVFTQKRLRAGGGARLWGQFRDSVLGTVKHYIQAGPDWEARLAENTTCLWINRHEVFPPCYTMLLPSSYTLVPMMQSLRAFQKMGVKHFTGTPMWGGCGKFWNIWSLFENPGVQAKFEKKRLLML